MPRYIRLLRTPLLLAAFLIFNIAAGKDLIIKASIGSVAGGISTNNYTLECDVLSIGIGTSISPYLDVIVSTKLGEILVPSASSDAAFDVSSLPLYIYFMNGISRTKDIVKPVPYIFGGVNLWGYSPVEHAADGLYCAGLGLNLSSMFLNFNIEGCWRRVYWERWDGTNDKNDDLSLKLRLELGGWWRIAR